MVRGENLSVLLHLLSPTTPNEFAAKYYAAKPLFVPGGREKVSGLFSWSDLTEVLGSFELSAQPVRIVRNGIFRKAPNHAAVARECRSGATLILDDLHERHLRVGELAASLTAELGEPVSVNVYYSQPGLRGFDTHYDTHDVFVLHLEGKKGWRVYGSPVEYPLSRQKSHPTEAPDDILLEEVMQAGDLLYIPRGYWHEATAQDEESLHLTIGVHVRTAADFMAWVTNELRDEVEWRKAFPLNLREENELEAVVPSSHFRHLTRLSALLGRKIKDPQLLADYRTFCIAQDRPVRQLLLPAMTQSELQEIGGNAVFRRPRYQRAVLRERLTGEFEVVVWGRIIEIADCDEELLKFVFGATCFSMGELLGVAPKMTVSGVTAVMRVFLEEGIVEMS